jgi:hypothetical protein
MKQAGFDQVFLGIENPDPAALNAMNKKQNVKVDIARTVATIQEAGIEVMAGFIFGGDEDTPRSADLIASFVEETAIPTAMTGMLSPIPHTPLTERLRAEGRLVEAEFAGNNTNDEVQFVPRHMTADEMRSGYYALLDRLFNPRAMYHRSGVLLERLRPHIFRGRSVRRSDLRAALRSVWRQGVLHGPRGAYYGLLWKAIRLDRARHRAAARAAAEVERRLRAPPGQACTQLAREAAELSALVDGARDAIVRADPTRSLSEVAEWAAVVKARIEAGAPTADDLRSLYEWSREFFLRQRRLHRFPGVYVEKAFNLAIKGLHYETAMMGVVTGGGGARPAS